jgi:hypothetical protein
VTVEKSKIKNRQQKKLMQQKKISSEQRMPNPFPWPWFPSVPTPLKHSKGLFLKQNKKKTFSGEDHSPAKRSLDERYRKLQELLQHSNQCRSVRICANMPC